ncbi:MAG: SDR family oxidoreductase [Minwuia sp.]|uniref:SDR family oxidoreductase n=1 Tax=Minwuia sp. TaxID=2493630 RepID=UPI003A883E93
MGGKVLIAGASGIVGGAAVRHFGSLPDWEVVALSRRAPDYDHDAEHLSLDLTDAGACEAAAAEHFGDVTHLVYAALYEKEDVIAGWRDHEQMRINDLMLRNLFGPLERYAKGLQHVSLMQGAKAYGVHIRHMESPAKERWPRDPHDNFYWLQEDYLKARQAAGKGWSWTIWRPHLVTGFSPGSPINMIFAVGAYAAICRELGEPLIFSGGPPFIQQMSDSRLIARGFAWAADNPAAAGNQIFNVANGDIVIWQNLYPAIARHFGLELGPPRPFSLAETMPAKEAVWRDIVQKHGLQPLGLAETVGASWQFADFVLGHGKKPSATVLSTVKLQQAGFHDCLDSEDALIDWFEDLQERRILPR